SAAAGLEALAPAPGWGGPGWRWVPQAASVDGSVIVGIGETAAREDVAFRWTEATGMMDLGALPGLSEARAWDLTPDGLTVVGDSDDRAFRWTPGGGMEQFPPGAQYMHAFGISADSSTIIGMSGARGFRWTTTDVQFFEIHQEPHAVSHDGSVFVGYEPGGSGAIRWVEGAGFVPMQFSPTVDDSGATDLSADGSVVVGWLDVAGRRAFVWDALRGARLLHEVLV